MVIAQRCLFLICCILEYCSAKILNCTVTQYADQTVCNISDSELVSGAAATTPVYTWANASGYVLANNYDKSPEQVLRQNLTVLVTSKCIDEIVFKCHPDSQPEAYEAYCRINCTQKAQMFRNNKEHIWIVLVTVILSLVVFGVIFCKFRDNISRICSCCPLRRFYNSVTMQDVDTKEADAEAGKV